MEYEGEKFFDWFGRELKGKFDVVLIDSRTGITEMSGVCTHQLADAVILLVAPNDQNLDGVKRIAKSLRQPELVSKGRKGRELHLLVVPSRVERAEGQKVDDFAVKFRDELAGFNDPDLLFQTNSFIDLAVPYVSHYAFVEDVAMREPESPKAADLVVAYTKVGSAMIELVPKTERIYLRYFSSQAAAAQRTSSLTFSSPPGDFIGRDSVFEAIANWLADTRFPMMMITGEPGSGKTALAAQLVASYFGKVALPRRSGLELRGLTFAYTCAPDADPMAFVIALAQALADRVQQFAIALSRVGSATSGVSMRVQQRIGTSPSAAQTAEVVVDEITVRDISPQVAFRQLVLNPLQTAHRSNGFSEPLLVLIDALDVLSEKPRAKASRRCLPPPRSLASCPRGLASCSLAATIPKLPRSLMGFGTILIQIRPRRMTLPFMRNDVSVHSSRPRGVWSSASSERLRARISCLRSWRSTKSYRAEEAERNSLPGSTPFSARRKHLTPWRRGIGASFSSRSGTIWSVGRSVIDLSALAVSRGSGLTRTQLRGILGRQPSEISDALKSVGEYLNTQSAEGPFRLFHSSFGKFLLTDGVYGMERAETNERIANYFITEYTGRWSSCQDQYAISYTATHLVDAAQSAEGRNDRARLLGKLAALVRAEDFLEAHLSHAPDGTLAEQISNAMDLSADQTEKATFAKLLEFLRAENTPKTSDQPESLTERIRLHLTAASASTTGLPPGNGSAEGAATVPQSVSPPANQPVSNEAEEEAELRRALPMSVRIELDVWRRAQTAGKVFLAVSVLVCTAAMVLALGPVPSVFLWIGKALYYVIVLAAIYSSLTVFLENRKAKSLVIGTSTASIAALPTPSDSPPEPDRPWEILPEVVALRAGGKRFQLFGAINVASPYFEIGTVLYIAIAVVASISPLSPFSR